MKKNFLLLVLLFPLFLFSQTKFSALSVPKEIRENANSVLMDEKVEVEITDTDRMIIKEYRVTAVYNDRGNGKVGAVVFHDENRKIRDLEAYVYDAMGNEVEHYKKRDFRDVSVADGFSLFNDNRATYLDYTPTSYPYTLVFVSEVITDDTAFIFPWGPVDGYTMGVLKSERIINFDPSNKVRYKAQNLDGLNIEINETPSSITCTAKNIKAVKYEEHAPPFSSIEPKVYFALDRFSIKGVAGSGTDWKEFGKWMNARLLAGMDDLPPSTVKHVQNLVANETTNQAKARKIYKYVQEKVRYISVQMGIGGWKPMPASEVDRLSYGDCKALTNYTKALLDAVGVPSYYTVLYAGDDEKNILQDFSSMQGNHVILGVQDTDEKITWLECTSQDTPYGYLGNFTDDRDVLMITPDGGEIRHTTVYDMEESLQKNTVTITVNNDGSAKASFTGISSGLQYDDKYLLEQKTETDLEKHYKERWRYHNGLEVEDIHLVNNRTEVAFTEKLAITIPSFAIKAGNDYLLELNAFNKSQYVPPRITDRKQDISRGISYKDVDSYDIILPEGYKLESLPENNSIKSKFGTYSLVFEEKDSNTIKYTRTISMKKGIFPPSDYAKYRNFQRSIVKLDKTKILLEALKDEKKENK